MALDGGEDGLDFYRSLADRVYQVLTIHPHALSHILLEVGYDQASAVKELFRHPPYQAHIFRDEGGHPRVVHLYQTKAS